MLEIDGGYGEAGGQILRTALSLSSLLNRPFRMSNIRKGRRRPGLMPQHLTCVCALALITNAGVKGDFQGSTELIFEPSGVKTGDYFFDIGTAGSTSLLLQAIIPPLIFAKERSYISLRGGTHVPFSPPFHYISDVFIPMLYSLGVRLSASIDNYGFYPKGGGEINVEIMPAGDMGEINLSERGEVRKITGISGVGNLSADIAERQRKAVIKSLAAQGLNTEINLQQVPALGQGTFVFIKSEADNCIAGFSSLGERGKKAETVGDEAAGEFIDYFYTSACLDHHLADQLVLYLALARRPSVFTTSRITDHLLTNLWVIEKFLGVRHRIEGEHGKSGTILINP